MKKNLNGILVWFLVTLFVVYAFFLNTAGAVFADTIKAFLNASDVEASLAVSSFIIGFAFMQIPGGYLLDRYNIRYVVSGGIFLLALGNLTLSFSNSLFLFSLSNFIQGLGASFAFVAVGKVISQWFRPNLFPILFGLTQTISCFAAAFIHYMLVQALKTITWQTIYQELAVFGFITFAAILLIVRSPANIKVVASSKQLSLKDSLALAFSNGQLWLCAFASATAFGTLMAYASFWYIRVEQFYSVSSSDALIISGMIFAGIGIGTPFLGWLSNRLKSRNLVIHLSLAIGNIFLLMCLYAPHFDLNSLIPIKIISFFAGFFLSGSMLYYTCVSELSKDNTRAINLSVVNTAVFLFNSLLLFIPYFFITKDSQSFFTYLWVLPSCVMVSMLLIYFVKETYKESKA